MTAKTLLCALAALALAGCASPSDPIPLSAAAPDREVAGACAPMTVAQVDEDRNGKITREEAELDAELAAAFERYDRNNNERLDRGEVDHYASERQLERAEFARIEAAPAAPGETVPSDCYKDL